MCHICEGCDGQRKERRQSYWLGLLRDPRTQCSDGCGIGARYVNLFGPQTKDPPTHPSSCPQKLGGQEALVCKTSPKLQTAKIFISLLLLLLSITLPISKCELQKCSCLLFDEVSLSFSHCAFNPGSKLREGKASEGDFCLLQKCPVWFPLQTVRYGLGSNAQVLLE